MRINRIMYVVGLVSLIFFITFVGIVISSYQYSEWEFWSRVGLSPIGWKIWIGLFNLTIIITNVFLLTIGINKSKLGNKD